MVKHVRCPALRSLVRDAWQSWSAVCWIQNGHKEDQGTLAKHGLQFSGDSCTVLGWVSSILPWNFAQLQLELLCSGEPTWRAGRIPINLFGSFTSPRSSMRCPKFSYIYKHIHYTFKKTPPLYIFPTSFNLQIHIEIPLLSKNPKVDLTTVVRSWLGRGSVARKKPLSLLAFASLFLPLSKRVGLVRLGETPTWIGWVHQEIPGENMEK